MVVGSGSVIGSDVAGTPVTAIRDSGKVTVAIEKHMRDALLIELLMELPDLLVCLLCALLPIHRHHEFFVTLLMAQWHIVDARRIDLPPLIIDPPFLTFPGAPLYHYQGLLSQIRIVSYPISRGTHDSAIAAGALGITVQHGSQPVGQLTSKTHAQIVGMWLPPQRPVHTVVLGECMRIGCFCSRGMAVAVDVENHNLYIFTLNSFMNDINDIYREFGEKFCICPFLGGFYQSHHVLNPTQSGAPSTIVPCSLTWWNRDSGDFNIVNNNIRESINQPVWREMRRAFANGEYESIPQCRICQETERAGGDPARKGANLHYVHHCVTDIVSEIKRIIDNDYRVDDILSLDWYPSNYCNYSCVMCSGGASTGRMSFEIKILRQDSRVVLNTVSEDFYDVIKRVEVINFTGGETAMQSQVHDMIDYLIDNDLAHNKTIFLLTNASAYPDELIEKFRRFRRVVYMCSIDGVGSVIEYQRRGARWPVVSEVSLRLLKHEFISCVANYVLTAINAPTATEFVDWLYVNHITNGVTVSPVFRVEYLGVAALPPELRDLTQRRLQAAIERYCAEDSDVARNCLRFLHAVQSVIDTTPFDAQSLDQFRQHCKLEDQASDLKLVDAAPDWRPYF